MFPTSLEFIIARSPHKMGVFMVGLWYAVFGLEYAIMSNPDTHLAVKKTIPGKKTIVVANLHLFKMHFHRLYTHTLKYRHTSTK